MLLDWLNQHNIVQNAGMLNVPTIDGSIRQPMAHTLCRRISRYLFAVLSFALLHACAADMTTGIDFEYATVGKSSCQPLGENFRIADGVLLRGFALKRTSSGDWLPEVDLQASAQSTQQWYLRVSISPEPGRTLFLPPAFVDKAQWQLQVPLGAPCESSTPFPDAALPGAKVSLAVLRTDARGAEVVTEYAGPVCDLGQVTSLGGAPNVFIRNASFESDSGAWTSVDVATTPDVGEHPESFSGLNCLATGPGYAYNTIVQEVTTTVSPAGRQLTLRAWAKAYEPDTCRLLVVLDGKRYYSPYHPGDGGWRPLTLVTAVPDSHRDHTFTVGLVHNGKPARTCYFDDVSAELADAPTS